MRIARNRAVDRRRANAARVRTAESDAVAPLAPETQGTRAASSEQRRPVARALDALPSEQRELIEQAYFQGLTQSEVAERHNHARSQFRERMLSIASAKIEEVVDYDVAFARFGPGLLAAAGS